VKTSASRLITTPLNFIFEPLGTERTFIFGFCDVVVVVTCPRTAGATDIKTARTQPTANG
jgi:hypothetical protein